MSHFLPAVIIGLFLLLNSRTTAAAVELSSSTSAETAAVRPSEADGWVELFNGKDLSGWKANETPGTFRVEDGLIVVHGDRSHLFYVGEVNGGAFKDFELWVELQTMPKANSGIYFHTEWQEEGWPARGYEVQVNQTHGDPRKTGGLYAVADVMDESPVKDEEWHSQHIKVVGKRIVVRVNGEVTTDYTEPTPADREGVPEGRRLDQGTFALQGHDPESVVRYRQIWVKPLPADKDP